MHTFYSNIQNEVPVASNAKRMSKFPSMAQEKLDYSVEAICAHIEFHCRRETDVPWSLWNNKWTNQLTFS